MDASLLYVAEGQWKGDQMENLGLILSWRLFLQEERHIQPESIAELQKAVEGFAGTIPEEMQIDATQNVRNRAQACIKASCSQFELFVKLSKKRRLSAI